MKKDNYMNDQDRMEDALKSQKFVTENYNSVANECKNSSIRNKMMNILSDEHRIQAEVFDSMEKRGWYDTKNAKQQEINQVKQSFNNSK